MKIIDLINMIARKDCDLPKQLKYNGNIYKFDNNIGDYRKDGYDECLLIKTIFGSFDCCGKHNSFYNMIYDKVEIIK